MIGKLKGIIDSIFTDHVIIDVQGVGYLVYLTEKTLSSLTESSPIELYIEMHIREDHTHLYGFQTLQEKKTYLILQKVGGVGAKMAMQILSMFSPDHLSQTIYKKDKDLLRTIPGVGMKLAERLIIELKDKLDFNGLDLVSNISQISGLSSGEASLLKDAVDALCNLGVQKNDAHQRISKILQSNPKIQLSDLITEGLRVKI